ncbi:MAG: Trm112 family protein [Hyphomicrobiaceae bacterium]
MERKLQNEPQVDANLLTLLVCPLTKTALEYDAVNRELVSRAAHLAYPIKDGIPFMAAETARRLE